jgi:acetyltransferase-like isoleucine patch superfamily enzyme
MPAKVIERIKKHPRLKKLALDMVVHPVKTRPRWWIRLFIPFYTRRGRGSVIYRSVRRDLLPNHRFALGRRSVVESFCALNNGVGDILIGDNVRVGIGSTVIGPVTMHDHSFTGQNCLISGLIHNYEDPSMQIIDQGVSVAPVVIGRGAYLGAHVAVVAGVTIGEHSVVGAGSVVTRDVPAWTVVAGVPARAVKRYDFEQEKWVRI